MNTASAAPRQQHCASSDGLCWFSPPPCLGDALRPRSTASVTTWYRFSGTRVTSTGDGVVTRVTGCHPVVGDSRERSKSSQPSPHLPPTGVTPGTEPA